MTNRPRLTPLLWLLSALFIVYGATIPFQFVGDRAFVLQKISRITLNPFVSPDTGLRLSVPDVVQNILLFVPFGVFGVAALGRRLSFPTRLVVVTVLGALLSGGVEAVQLFTIDRTTSVADLVANTAGAFAGGVGWFVGRGVFRGAVELLGEFGLVERPSFYPLMVATLVICAAAWEPFDVTLDVGSLWSKVKSLLVDPLQMRVITDEGLQLVRFMWLTILACVWTGAVRGRKTITANRLVVVVCAVGGVALEASQLFIGTRMPGLEDALVNVAGVVAGAWLCGWIAAMPPRRLLILLIIATWVGTALQMLSPFQMVHAYRTFAMGWMPFFGSYANTTTEALSHTFELVLIYLPIGFAIGWLHGQGRRTYLAAAVVAALMELPIEYLQGWVGGRYPDATDVLLAALGVTAGVWVAGSGWARFRDLVGVSRIRL